MMNRLNNEGRLVEPAFLFVVSRTTSLFEMDFLFVV